MKKIRGPLVALAAALLLGCGDTAQAKAVGVSGSVVAYVSDGNGSATVFAVRDSANGVICYVAVGINKAGIDCVEVRP